MTMEIKRIDNNRKANIVERIEVMIDGIKYTITERFGELKVHAHSDEVIVKPCCANEVVLQGIDRD